MAIKKNHKIFNLIIMIILCIYIISISFYSNAVEIDTENQILIADVIYGGEDIEKDYQPEEEKSDIENTDDGLWNRVNTSDFFQNVRTNVAKWYFILRYISITIMLIIFIVLGIKLAIASLADKKALYKKMLLDWIVCFILIFFIHYFMIFILLINEKFIDILYKISINIRGDSELGLYETVRSRAYDIKFTVGFSGMLIYMTLVFTTAKYVYMYFKRFLIIILLTLLAPLIILLYALQKILFGKSKVFTKWMEEYAVNVLLQSIHALVYVVFVSLALRICESSLAGIIIALIALNYMSKADSLFRRVFKFSDGSSLAEEIANSEISELKDNLTGAAVAFSVAKQTNIGQKVMEGYANAAKIPVALGIRTLSALENSNAGTTFLENMQQSREDKDEFLRNGESAINELEEELDKKQKELLENKNENGDELNAQERKDLQKDIEKLNSRIKRGKRITKKNLSERKKNNYFIRRKYFERIRNVLDPDTYMEYKLDKNGNKIKGKHGYKRRVVKKRKVYNAETDSYEVVSGLRKRFKSVKKDVLGLKDEQKELIDKMTQLAKDGALGFGAMLLGMGTIANNPSIGLGLLASGISKTRRVLKKKDNGLKISKDMERRINDIIIGNYDKDNSDVEFSSEQYLELDKIIDEMVKRDPSVGRINRIQALLKSKKLKYNVPLFPFVLTGTKGYLRNVMAISKEMAQEVEREVKKYKMGVYTEVQKAISKEIVENYEKVIKSITSHIYEKNIYRLMEDRRFLNKTVFVAKNGIRFAFNSEINQNILTKESKIRQAIIDTAFDRSRNICITNLAKLDFNNAYTQKRLLENLRKQGVLLNNSSLDSVMSDIEKMRSELIEKNKNIIHQKAYESAIMSYMLKYGITDKSELETDDAKKIIDETYFEIIHNNIVGKDAMNLILTIVSQKQLSLKNVSINELLESNSDLLEKLKQSMFQANYSEKSMPKILEKNISLSNKMIEDIILDIIANKRLQDKSKDSINVSEIDLSDDSNAKMVELKSEMLIALKMSGINISDEDMVNILSQKLTEITNSDVEKEMLKILIDKYIKENWNGDARKLNNPKYAEELNEYLTEKLLNTQQDDEDKKNVDTVLELLKQDKSRSEDDVKKALAENELLFGIEEDETDYNLDSSIPTPIIKTKIINNMLYCIFDVPVMKNSDEFSVEIAISDENSAGKFVYNSTCTLTEETEFVTARLVHMSGKHGKVLVVKYPAEAINIVSSIRDDRKEEKDKKLAESVRNEVLDTLDVLNPNSASYLEDLNGEQQTELALNEEIQRAFKLMEVVDAVNDVEDVRKSIEMSKNKFSETNDEALETVSKALEDTEALMNLRYRFDTENENYIDYEDNMNALMKKLLKEKMISEEQEKLKIKSDSEEYKKYKKAKKSSKEKLKNMNFYDIINSVEY